MTIHTAFREPADAGTTRAEPDRSAPAERRFRPDIQGLRAVAVLMVVLYHARIPMIRGGFAGVDVFFVISGFLITGQLLREIDRSGRIALGDFYLRRIRRLLPPAALVLLATLAAAWLWEPPLEVRDLGIDASFAALYALNYRLAAHGIDYQHEATAPSALQHFWSLGVEEQFYLAWPLIILIVLAVLGRRWRLGLIVVLALITASSLAESQSLTSSSPPLAYFTLQSRAWELGVGGLIALAVPVAVRLPRRLAAPLSWAGLTGLVLCTFLYTDDTSFPGMHALVPVLSAALIIIAGCAGAVGAEAVLQRRSLQFIGKLSYPWYLWHWPVLLLAPMIAPGHAFGWLKNAEMAGIALWLAALTYYLLEYPVRKSAFRRWFWAGAGVLLSAGTSAAGLAVGLVVVLTMGNGASVAALRPALGSAAPSIADPFSGGPYSGPVLPAVAAAIKDTPDYPADCLVPLTGTSSPSCLIGPDGRPSDRVVTSRRVVLIGDSHAGQWFNAVHAIAGANRWPTEVLTKAGCPLPDITVVNQVLKRPYTECDIWRRAALIRLLHEPAPKVIFVSSLNWYTDPVSAQAKWRITLKALERIGAPIVYLKDSPHPTQDVPLCLSKNLPAWGACAFARARAFQQDPVVTVGTRALGVAAIVDVNRYLCPGRGTSCPAVRGGVLLYRDASHLTSTAAAALTGAIRKQLQNKGLHI